MIQGKRVSYPGVYVNFVEPLMSCRCIGAFAVLVELDGEQPLCTTRRQLSFLLLSNP